MYNLIYFYNFNILIIYFFIIQKMENNSKIELEEFQEENKFISNEYKKKK